MNALPMYLRNEASVTSEMNIADDPEDGKERERLPPQDRGHVHEPLAGEPVQGRHAGDREGGGSANVAVAGIDFAQPAERGEAAGAGTDT